MARGLDVVAVEPLDGMRAELARAVPGARLLAGSAERIPLADGAVDAVLAAQAWHWVDPARAVPEVARVLAPGGTLGLLWNERDERESWVAELGRIIGETRPEEDGPEEDGRKKTARKKTARKKTARKKTARKTARTTRAATRGWARRSGRWNAVTCPGPTGWPSPNCSTWWPRAVT